MCTLQLNSLLVKEADFLNFLEDKDSTAEEKEVIWTLFILKTHAKVEKEREEKQKLQENLLDLLPVILKRKPNQNKMQYNFRVRLWKTPQIINYKPE